MATTPQNQPTSPVCTKSGESARLSAMRAIVAKFARSLRFSISSRARNMFLR